MGPGEWTCISQGCQVSELLFRQGCVVFTIFKKKPSAIENPNISNIFCSKCHRFWAKNLISQGIEVSLHPLHTIDLPLSPDPHVDGSEMLETTWGRTQSRLFYGIFAHGFIHQRCFVTMSFTNNLFQPIHKPQSRPTNHQKFRKANSNFWCKLPSFGGNPSEMPDFV